MDATEKYIKEKIEKQKKLITKYKNKLLIASSIQGYNKYKLLYDNAENTLLELKSTLAEFKQYKL